MWKSSNEGGARSRALLRISTTLCCGKKHINHRGTKSTPPQTEGWLWLYTHMWSWRWTWGLAGGEKTNEWAFTGIIDEFCNQDALRLSWEEWKMQFKAVRWVGGSEEDQKEASVLDYVYHIVSLPFQIVFATVPPQNNRSRLMVSRYIYHTYYIIHCILLIVIFSWVPPTLGASDLRIVVEQ